MIETKALAKIIRNLTSLDIEDKYTGLDAVDIVEIISLFLIHLEQDVPIEDIVWLICHDWKIDYDDIMKWIEGKRILCVEE